MPLHRCGFQLDRKTCLHSTCDGSGLGPGPPAPGLWVAVQSLPLGKAAARALRVVVGSSTYLRPPVGADRWIAPDPAKCVREGIVGSPEQPESEASGGASAPSLSLTRSEPSWTLRAPLPRISHPDWLPQIQSAAPQQKISLYRDSSNTSQGKPDVK